VLGDAAHPQTPFMGQGVNQAITDAFVCSMRLAREPVVKALQDYDSKARRQGVNGVIEKARSYGDMSVSKSRIVCWLFYAVARWMSLSWLMTDMVDADTPNHDFVAQLDKDLAISNGEDRP
jgi:2-polyprenyl-6-methoxyphenol hydroxylase-like FAD-dependent oxidoreductase